MNIHMAKKGQKGRTKVVCKGTFILKQTLNESREIIMILSQIDGHTLINNYVQLNLNLVFSYFHKSERS